jgi:uncharacterized membrane protein
MVPDADRLADQRHGITLAGHDERHGATVALANHNNHVALAGLLFGEPAILAVVLPVLGLDMTAEIGAVDFRNLLFAVDVGVRDRRPHSLAQLVQQHESALRVDVDIAADL